MSKKNNDFFKEKKIWSEVKDELLGCYLRPYFSKISSTFRPIMYIDCFAGKGKFDDGKNGSPLIALDIIEQCKIKKQVKIESVFIDLNYANDLHINTSGYDDVQIISDNYENVILDLLQNKRDYNVFLYIDPYGIKALQSSLFDTYSQKPFNSIELLINFNSFGFIREACHSMGIKFREESMLTDLVEYDSTHMDHSQKSVQELNKIAGGDYWQQIIYDYKNNTINGYDAEMKFSLMYCNRLKMKYNYVLNMPLRLKEGQRPKYRLIHCTNHEDGCLLMAENMCNHWEVMKDIQNDYQTCLWDENHNNEIINPSEIETKVREHYSKYKEKTRLKKSLAEFFTQYGIICPSKDIKNILLKLKEEYYIEIERNPAYTQGGKPTKFMNENKNHKVYIRWLR